MMTHSASPARHGDTWGPWRYDADAQVLIYGSGTVRYRVDLDRCRTSPETMAWVRQVAGNSWATDADLGALLRAILATALR
ncbi:MAG: hypothetical protein Q8N53_24890 [Longimicrobiales bacterium]|nr:hypothetical protein [Longimicrobiales bacterium]